MPNRSAVLFGEPHAVFLTTAQGEHRDRFSVPPTATGIGSTLRARMAVEATIINY